MKTLYLLLFFCGANLISNFSYSQIISYPYYQDFESAFQTGTNTEFIPGWIGNDIQPSTRIYQGLNEGANASSSLVVTPTSTFSGIITIAFNFKSLSNPLISFIAKSIANGTGTYPSRLELSVSADGGATYSTPEEIGQGKFVNANTEYVEYSYAPPSSVAGKENVIIKIAVKRGSTGSGTVAKISLDNFSVTDQPDERQKLGYRSIQINEIFADPTGSQPPDSLVLPNYEFVELYNSTDQLINLKGFSLSGVTLPAFDFPGKSYLIACPSASAAEYSKFGKVLPLASWNTLTNTGEKVYLKDLAGEFIDSITYSLNFYTSREKQDGGWSIEQIDPNVLCNGPYNYTASTSIIGATPGSQNSVLQSQVDILVKIETAKLINNKTIQVDFNKPIDSNLFNKNLIEHPVELEIEGLRFERYFQSLILYLDNPLISGKLYNFGFSGITDCAGTFSPSLTFEVGNGTEAEFNEVIISEIMADPSPSQGQPESEYLEFYNRSANVIALEGITLVNNAKEFLLPPYNLRPHEFLLLCPASAVESFGKDIAVLGLTQWPSLLNDGGLVLLKTKEQRIFSIEYSNKWYQRGKEDGGFSLEMIDLNNPCMERGNWQASENIKGGTPGKANSVTDQRLDLHGPLISNIDVLSDTALVISFDEKLGQSFIKTPQVLINPFVAIKNCIKKDNSSSTALVTLSSSLLSKTLYTLTIADVEDCSGNRNSPTGSFALPELIEPGDILINEILFNPRKGGVDFIEFYNKSDKYLSLKNLIVARADEGEIKSKSVIDIGKTLLAPKEIFALTSDKSILKSEYPKLKEEHVFESKNLASFPDDKGTAILINGTQTINEFSYLESYHLPLLKSKEGVSLERISENTSSNDKNNWHSASADQGFATPGYKNSQAFDPNNLKKEIELSSRIFSPDGDGYEDFLLVNYMFGSAGTTGTIKIYDRNGQKIKTLLNNQTLATEGLLQWDGTTEDGKKASIGLYLLVAEFFNLNGKTKRIKEEVVVAGRL